jgi:hypothetical protein
MVKRLALVLALGMVATLAPASAFAQDEGEQPAPPPPPPVAPTQQPPPARRTTIAHPPGAPATDHEEVIQNIGFQVAFSAVNPMGAPAGANPLGVTNVGVRYWFNEKIGLDAGLGVTLVHLAPDNGDGDTAIAFGLNAGVPIAIGIYKHITTFFSPDLAFYLFKPSSDADTAIRFDLAGSVGFEWQLGWVEASRISLTLKMGAGLDVQTKALGGMNTVVSFGTGGGSSVEGLFSSSLALTFYL